jgi:YggT family protein
LAGLGIVKRGWPGRRRRAVRARVPAPLVPISSSVYTSAPDAGTRVDVMLELLNFISYLITLYTYVIIAGVILSWLLAFNVINGYNPFVRSLWNGLRAVTEPLLVPIRRILPDLGGIDISPVILLLACFFVQSVVLPNIAKLFI